jgi:hypothetical protein
MSTDLQVVDAAVPDALTTQAVLAQVRLIHSIMTEVMIKDTHYGVIPGTGTKPTLLKAGAEKLLLTFRLDPQYESSEHFLGEHLFVRSKCTLYHQTTGRRMGSGEGSCCTTESKYAWRPGKRLCPNCGKDAIIKGKEEYGGGWLCFGKKGGCGAKWPNGAVEIEGQSTERVPNEDVADQYNTVLKMADKRSLIAAILNVTAASDIFTQDVEDLPIAEAPKPPVAVQEPMVEPPPVEAPTDQPGPFRQALDGVVKAGFIWKIGKEHQGESIATIPGGYLEWFITNGKRADHVEAATVELDRRRGQSTL